MYEEQNKKCKGNFLHSPYDDFKKLMIICLFSTVYLDGKNAFNPAEEYNKYQPRINAEECKWFCYTPEFKELADCVNNVVNYNERFWTEECSKRAQQCVDECKLANEKIQEALHKSYPDDLDLRILKRKVRTLTRHEFRDADMANLDIIQYCHNVKEVPKLWFLEPINYTREEIEACVEENPE